MADEQLINLIEKYLDGKASEAEKLEVEQWFENLSDEDKVFYNNDPDQIRQAAGRSMLAIKKKIALAEPTVIPLNPKRRFAYIAAAASVLLCCSIGLYIYKHQIQKPATTQFAQNDVSPGGNKAILTLANGKKISLTDAKNGTIATENKVAITKTADGQVTYAATATTTATPSTVNTLETPKGGQYHLTLADGTQVWLNSASSLKYPSAFTGTERKVELTGEAYFEVAHNTAIPFRVVAAGETVEDIGTHFNINAYTDEPAIKTTLLEGSVKVSQLTTHNSQILKPGQQSIIQQLNNSIIVRNADGGAAIAWKNGYFQFENENIQSIMRKVSRWYDVDVVYAPGFTNQGYMGSISRFKDVSQVLKMLQLTGTVHFKVEGRRITVMQ